jgi:anthranilate synthase component 2
MRLLVLDNYDSFTWNLVQYAAEAGAEPIVHRNDALTVAAALGLGPDAILISPGPCTPGEAGISVPLIRAAAGSIPMLGVCLGHQAIAEAFGGSVIRALRPMHGKTAEVVHAGTDIFAGLPSPFTVMRYHSLIVAEQDLPAALAVTAWHGSGRNREIMALRHVGHPIFGVQFHPESIGTEHGRELLRAFLSISVRFKAAYT